MIKKKILVFGVSGLTGYKIAKIATSKFEVYGTFNSRTVDIPSTKVTKINVTNDEEIKNIFSEVKPNIVINTTALHNVDYCEDHQEEANRVNEKAVNSILKNSEKCGAKLIHISTDYVFDGNQSVPYTEDALPNPISYYGQSKLNGEKIFENSNHIVIRVFKYYFSI